MPVINYAVEIYLNNNTMTDIPHGLNNGVFRFITGRPGYDGSGPYPQYATGEIDINGNLYYIINDNNDNTNVYYQDFLIKDGIDGNAQRSVDITCSGSYGNQSTFSFKLRGDKISSTYFWEFCSTNSIVLSNSIVVFYAIIDGTFWSLYRGRIKNDPYTETDFTLECTDEADVIHKIIPPYVDTVIKTSISGATTQVSSISNANINSISTAKLLPNQTSEQVTIPVVMGDVGYSPLIKTNDQSNYVVLDVADQGYGDDLTEQYATSYHIATAGEIHSGNPYVSWVEIVTNSTLHKFVLDDPELVGKYLVITSGKDADTDQTYKILGNDVTGLPGGSGTVYKVAVTRLYLDGQLATTGNLLATEANFNSNNPSYPSTGYAFYLGSLSNSTPYQSANTWFFRVSDFRIETEISTTNYLDPASLGATQIIPNSYGKLSLYSWDDNSKAYVDLSSLVAISSSGTLVSLIANHVDKDAKVQLIESIDFPIQEFGVRNNYVNANDWPNAPRYPTGVIAYTVDQADIDSVTNKIRNDPGYLIDLGTAYQGGNFYIYARYLLNPLINTYDRILFLVDYDLTWHNITGYPLGVWIYRLRGLSYSPFGYQDFVTHPFTLAGTDPANNLRIPTGQKSQVNLIPNDYYYIDPLLADPTSLSLYLQENGVSTGKPYSWFYDFGNVTNGSNDAVTTDSNHLIQCAVGVYAAPGGYGSTWDDIKVYIKQIVLLGVRTVDTITSDLFTKVEGELTGYGPGNPTHTSTDLGQPTNDLYHTCMHIMEDYDGIPYGLINYGTGITGLATARGPGTSWNVGRTLIDQQSSQVYLNEICSQSFVCLFGNRKGQREFNAWLGGPSAPNTQFLPPTSGTGKTSYHDSTLIIDGSIQNVGKTDFTQIYNAFQLSYNWDPGSKSYTRSFNVQNIDVTHQGYAFPPESDPTWHNYVTGLSDSDWFEAASVWYQCINSFISNTVNQLASLQLSELPWFIDEGIYQGNSTLDPASNAAWVFLQFMVYWTTRQKDIITYNIPINASTIGTELLDCIQFKDDVYTAGVNRVGWITSIEVDAVNNQYILQVFLQSADMAAVELPDGLDERPDFKVYIDSLNETSINTDSLTE